MTTTQLDKSKPYKSVKDFVTNRTTIIQNGKSFNEQGFPIIVASAGGPRYLCPQCDFGSASTIRLFEHAEKVHHASDTQVDVLKVYVQNIDRGLPADEGIDWQKMTVARTTAQKAYDEREMNTGKTSSSVAEGALTCEMCPDLPPFKNKAALGTHRWHKHKIKKGG